MSNITTLTNKLNELPEDVREKLARYINEHFEDLKDEMRWDESFDKTSGKLSEFAQKARREIAEGKSEPMNFDEL